MNAASSLRRPTGSLKSIFRLARLQRQHGAPQRRTLAATARARSDQSSAAPPSFTAPATPSSEPIIFTPKRSNSSLPSKAFALAPHDSVYSPARAHPDPVRELRRTELARLDPTGARTALFDRANADHIKPGDVLLVTMAAVARDYHVPTGGAKTAAGKSSSSKGPATSDNNTTSFAGVLIALRRRGPDTAILLRGRLTKIAVEMWVKVYSPGVRAIEVVWRRPKRARRAKLTYMRQPKHDMGDVRHLVEAWHRQRRVFGSSAGSAVKGR